MIELEKILEENCESEIIDALLEIHHNKIELSEAEISALHNFVTSNYALLGLIGLLLNEKARILLGQKQTYHTQIQNLCLEAPVNYADRVVIADWDIDKELNEVEEFVWRKVMLEYPANYED
jgi:hypothetical protein